MTVAIYADRDEIKNLNHVNYSAIDFYSWTTKQEFIHSQHKIKVAVIEPDYQCIDNLLEICEDLKFCNLVVIYSMELTQQICNIIRKFDLSNFVFIVNGTLNFSLNHAKFITNTIWLYSTAYYYLNPLKTIVDSRLTPFAKKQFKFDVLYGRIRPHRKFVKDRLTEFDHHPWFYQSPMFDKVISGANKGYHTEDSEFWEDEIVFSTTQDYCCTYFDISMNISQVLPFKIYNKTNYSLVCETSYENDFNFFSEKIAKPIIANRLFIVISGQYYLRNLKSLGFETFDSIIDESYDLEPDEQTRWNMALDQAIWLCQQDTDVVLKKITPILLHNTDTISRLQFNQLQQVVSEFLITNGYYKK